MPLLEIEILVLRVPVVVRDGTRSITGPIITMAIKGEGPSGGSLLIFSPCSKSDRFRSFGDTFLKRRGVLTAQPDVTRIDLSNKPLKWVSPLDPVGDLFQICYCRHRRLLGRDRQPGGHQVGQPVLEVSQLGAPGRLPPGTDVPRPHNRRAFQTEQEVAEDFEFPRA